jgi:predicted transcriptional regulator
MPYKNDYTSKSIACETIEISNWQFLFWLVSVHVLTVVDVLYLTKFIFVIAGCRDVLDNTSRSRVYTYIKTKPGAYISEIKEELVLARGTVKRYVHVLRVMNKIESYKDGGKIRYFAATTYNEEEKRVISALQNTNNKKIISEIQSGRCITNIDLAREFGFSRATISWYVSNLKEIGLIEETKKGKTRIYRINDSYNSLFSFIDDK